MLGNVWTWRRAVDHNSQPRAFSASCLKIQAPGLYKTPPASRLKIAIVAAIIGFRLLRHSLKNQSKGRRYGAA
jgi:hypothetical protein